MVRRNRTNDRSISLFLLGMLLLLPPVLLVFNRPDRILGIPVFYLYVFVVWSALIALGAAIARSIPREEADAPPAPEGRHLQSPAPAEAGRDA